MTRLEMNFARRTTSSSVVWILLLVSIAGCLYSLWQRELLLEEMEVQRHALSRIERTLSQQEFTQVVSKRESPKAQIEARALVAALQRPWGAMLDALKRSAQPNLKITRVQPDAVENRLLVSGHADSSEAFLGFVERLRKAPEWSIVEPVSQERRDNLADLGAPALSFQLVLEWRER